MTMTLPCGDSTADRAANYHPAMATREVGRSRLAKRFLLGPSLATSKAEHQLLPKLLALPVFSSDALSSVAYATEEMMLVLTVAGAGALGLTLPLAVGVAILLAIVVTSYRQTVKAYPRGGGSYIVARENLGTVPGLLAAAAILCDYVLTVAVSVTAGTIAVTSAAPSLARHKVLIGVGFIALITLANLRGVRESGKIFAVPTYGFVAMVGIMLVTGFVRCLGGCPVAETANLPVEPVGALSLFLVLRAFASGSTALTGVEAIADGVQAFQRPQAKNASQTLAIMGGIGISMFIGITLLAVALHVRVNGEISLSRSVLSQVGETVFGRTFVFFLLQALTAGILILAANTSFQDFPRLSSILARDRYMPSQFRNRGDRLVFSNGVIVLAIMASLLVYAFHAELTGLIQLYVVGVFTAFTLSQAGMVLRWRRTREANWRRSAIINGVGATATAIVLVIVIVTKFVHGAWIVLVAVPLIVMFFLAVHRHYERVATLLRMRTVLAEPSVAGSNHFLVLVPDFGPATADAVAYLRALRPDHVTPLYVGAPERFEDTAARWENGAPRLGHLRSLEGHTGSLLQALGSHLQRMDLGEHDFVTVLLPETVAGDSWWQLIRQRKNLWLKASLLFKPHVVVMDAPLVPQERADLRRVDHPLDAGTHHVIVPVSAVHDATVRAVRYASLLPASETEALFFASDPEQTQSLIEQWWATRLNVPISLVEAPFRDIGAPLLAEIRRRTSRTNVNVTVVLPEFVVTHWWEQLLHNQTALYIKRLLLLEPHVVLASVPFHLDTSENSPETRTERGDAEPRR
jgi:amino acid transporter